MTASMMLNRYGEGQPCLVPHYNGNILSFSLITTMFTILALNFHYYAENGHPNKIHVQIQYNSPLQIQQNS